MIRLVIAILHTVLALGTTSGAVLVLSQGRANAAWEQAFYGEISGATASVMGAGVLATLLGTAHAASAWAWFAGSERGAWVLIAMSAMMMVGAPWPVVVVLLVTSVLVLLDRMVEHHRAEEATASPRR